VWIPGENLLCTKLTAKGYVQEFRDALLKRQPMLLDQLLRHAIEGGEVEASRGSLSYIYCKLTSKGLRRLHINVIIKDP
jgi:hypothetical protein